MQLKNYLVALLGATVGYLAGEFIGGYVFSQTLVPRGMDTDLSWIWLPWILSAVAGAIAGAVIFRCTESTAVWHWLVLAVPVPVGAYIVTQVYFSTRGFPTPGLIRDSLIQLAISIVITSTIGILRMRRHSVRTRPVRLDSIP